MEPSESPTRELTLDEAVSFAILLQKSEQFVEARELYRRVILVRCTTPAWIRTTPTTASR